MAARLIGEVICRTAARADIGVALTKGGIAGTLPRIAHPLAFTARKPVFAYWVKNSVEDIVVVVVVEVCVCVWRGGRDLQEPSHWQNFSQ